MHVLASFIYIYIYIYIIYIYIYIFIYIYTYIYIYENCLAWNYIWYIWHIYIYHYGASTNYLSNNQIYDEMIHFVEFSFVDNKLSIHFDEDKTKSILFSSKSKIKEESPLHIQYKGKKAKQYLKITYLGWIFDETLSAESMATYVINKVNSRLRFFYRQSKFLDIPLRRLLCNAMIHSFFDYACNAWYPNLNKNFKNTFIKCWK